MSQTRLLLKDLQTTLREAATAGMNAELNDQTVVDIADKLIVWLLTEARGGRGWANVRVLFPKTNYPSRVRAIVALVESGLSQSAVARMFNIERSTVTKICSRERADM